MPSGKTHDAFTFVLAIPVAVFAYILAGSFAVSLIITSAFLFGGLMFGPDLDTHSNQYTRWGIFRVLWFPYQKFFKHRSRWSHGYIFGTLLRVIYFAGVLTLLSFLYVFIVTIYQGGEIPHVFEYTRNWRQIGVYIRSNFGDYVLYFTFVGLWLGAASHSIVDMIMTFVKTGRIGKVL